MSRPLVLLTLLLAGAAGEDFVTPVALADVRLLYGPAPRQTHLDLTGGGARRELELDPERSGRLALLWLPWPGRATPEGAGLWAFEIASTRIGTGSADQANRLDLRRYELLGHLGLGWAIGHGWTVETTGFLGAGIADPGSSGDPGRSYDLGFRGSLTWTAAWGPQLGASVAVSRAEADFALNRSGTRLDAHLVQSGLAPAVSVGWRW